MSARQPMVKIGDPPSSFKYQAGNFCHLGEIDFVDRIRGPVIVHRSAIKIKDDGHAFARKVKVVAAVIDPVRIGGVIKFVVEFQR